MMKLCIEDADSKAKAYMDSLDGRLFLFVYIEETNKQYVFCLEEKDVQLINYMIEQGKN